MSITTKTTDPAVPAPAPAPAPAPTAPPPPLYTNNREGNSNEDEDEYNRKNHAFGTRHNKGGNYAGRGVSIIGDGLTQSGNDNIAGGINIEEGGTLNIERTGKEGSDTIGFRKSTHHNLHPRDHLRVDSTTDGSSGKQHELSSKQTTGIIIGVFVLIIIIILVVMFATRCFGSSDTAVNSSEDATNNPSGSNNGASNDTTNNPSGSNDGASNDTTNNPSGSNDSGNQKETT